MEAGESEGGTKADLRAVRPQWLILMAHSLGISIAHTAGKSYFLPVIVQDIL